MSRRRLPGWLCWRSSPGAKLSMLSLDDPRWQQLCGGYRIPFDPRPLLAEIERDPYIKNWGLLAEELVHQGDVGDASYAAVPQIARIALTRFPLDTNALTLVTVIEIARWSQGSLPIPDWLTNEYELAIERLAGEALNLFAQLED